MPDSILVTGATGFLGSAIVEELLSSTEARVYVLVREKDGRTPLQRLKSLWCERPVLYGALGSRVIALQGDINQAGLGLAAEELESVAAEVGSVIHAAAEVGINQTKQRFWDVNVRGTFNVLEFAKHAAERGKMNRFVYISTAYVAGRCEGHIPEALVANPQFNSLYEWSKHEAELLVSSYGSVFPYTIVRPAQIVGDSRTGFVQTFNTLYYPLKLYLKSGLRVVPAARDLRVNMVPVDYVSHVVCRSLQDSRAEHAVLHAVAQTEELATLEELVEVVRLWAREHLGVNLPAPLYVPLPGAAEAGRAWNMHQGAHPKRKGLVRNLLALAPYFSENRTFDNDLARRVAGRPFPDWRQFLPSLLEYACRRGFLNYTDRTVFEQMLLRLRPGASTSIDYFDVGSEGIVRTSGTAAHEQILTIAHALIAQGVKPGDRVATIGVNSVRYFTVDAAIGLTGAANVPLYYTSPLADVYDLVKASGAGVLIAGTDRMLDELDVQSVGACVIAMSDRSDLREGIMPWKDFLASAAGHSEPLPWVAPDQVATIRYTSGTTGQPKGVLFDQRQARWMGEVMPAVLDWRTRSAKQLSYLSFLPMSHVVEGILVAYAPYYILADLQMYYLNDFPSLAQTLPKVRPHLFFSVPRFYEKVWNQFAATGAGKLWIGLPDGALKHVMAVPLRYVVLRRAGLDRCRQLIVGSAPIGMDLLESFRSLGIEIHNAFGVTEAPLITLSRLGENELGSVGRLLPDTQARIGDDGQVYVRGPQVTLGYDGESAPAVDEEGWFCTGDLAEWSAQGNLVLKGRKKEILVTSYGKNIAPQKIEVALKGIDGVSEAVVIADGRPFTTALLWLEEELGAVFDGAALDAAIRDVNGGLSHPEQVKRWAVASRALSIARGELTPNLKVRRNVVEQTRAGLIDVLYGGWESDGKQRAVANGEALHWGETA